MTLEDAKVSIQKVEKEVDSAIVNRDQLLSQLNIAKQQLSDLEIQVSDCQSDKDALAQKIIELEQRIDELQSPPETEPIPDPEPPETEIQNEIVTQDAIRWNVSSVPVGRFANGDSYVVGQEVPVSTLPEPSSGRNGQELNPSYNVGAGYDSRLGDYYLSRLEISSPYTLRPGDSLVSSRSHDSDLYHYDLLGRRIGIGKGVLKQAAILTCLSSPVSPSIMRPAYSDLPEDPRFYDSAVIDWSKIPSVVPFDPDPNNYALASRIKYHSGIIDAYTSVCGGNGPWLWHVHDWIGRKVHPTFQQPNYHREVYSVLADACLLAFCNTPIEERKQLIINLCQMGIDIIGVLRRGIGGYIDSSAHKIPCLIFLRLFNLDYTSEELEILNSYGGFRTDYQTYYLPGGSRIKSTRVPAGDTWNGWPVAWRQEQSGLDAMEYEHLHPLEWSELGQGGGAKREKYRRINSAGQVGALICSRILGLPWGDDGSFSDYVERWMSETDQSDYLESTFGFNELGAWSSTCSSRFVRNSWYSLKK